MPKTADIRPLAVAYRQPTESEQAWIDRTSRRKRKLPPGRASATHAGRPPVHDLSAWPVGACLDALPDDLRRVRQAAVRRGFVVATIGPGVLARLA